MHLEKVVDMLVQPEERGVPGRRLEVFHDPGRHSVALLRVRDLGQHHVTVVVQLTVEHRVDAASRRFDQSPQQVDAGGVVKTDQPSVGLQGRTNAERDGGREDCRI